MHGTPDVSLADASAALASMTDVTSDEFRDAFHTFYRACGRAAQVPSQQDLEAPLIKACVTQLAQLTSRRRILWRQIHDCTQKLRSLPGWEDHLQSDIALNILKGAGIYGGWDQLGHVQPGEPLDSPGKYRMTQQSSVHSGASLQASLSAPLAELTQGTVVDIEDVVCNDTRQLWGLLSIEPGWILLLDMQTGFRAAVREAEAHTVHGTRQENEVRSFLSLPDEEEEETCQLIQLEDIFNRLCDLATVSEESEEQQNEIAAVRTAMVKEWHAYQRNSRLHYVFGGLVSSGKTTLLNSWLVNSLDGFPADVELLPSDILENTSMVAVLEVHPENDTITMHTESIRYEEGAANNINVPVCSQEKMFKSVSELMHALPDVVNSIERSPGSVCRVVIRLPFAFVPFMAEESEQKEKWIKRQLAKLGSLGRTLMPKSSELQSTREDSLAAAAMAPIIVDTPGLDSLLVKHQLLSLLQEKSCVYAFLVDMTKPNPFGNQGFETLKFLVERLRLPFPPVILFTKWEKFVRQWDDIRFRKREAKNQSPAQVAKRLIQMVFTKLQQADLKVMPYFASVNAQAALLDINDGVDADEKNEILEAKVEMKSFMQSLHNLGSQVASPLRDHRVLIALMEKTQRIVNVVLRDSEEARLLSKQAAVELTDVASGLKAKYRANVKRYFEEITWTQLGVAAFEPPAPFNRNDCAINLIPVTFKKIISDYKNGTTECGKPENESLRLATLAIANLALKEIQHMILQDMHRFQQEIMSEFEEKLWSKIGNKVNLISDCQLTRMESAIGYATMFGSVLTATGTYATVLSAASTATAAGTGVLAGCGAATAVTAAAFAAIIPLSLGVAWLSSHHIGWWSWETCEEKAFEEIMQSLKTGQPEIMSTLIHAFDCQLEEMMKTVREFRVPDSSREDTRTAANIIEKVILAKHQAEHKVKRVLSGPPSQHWLSGNDHLKQIWLQVVEGSAWASDASASSSWEWSTV